MDETKFLKHSERAEEEPLLSADSNKSAKNIPGGTPDDNTKELPTKTIEELQAAEDYEVIETFNYGMEGTKDHEYPTEVKAFGIAWKGLEHNIGMDLVGMVYVEKDKFNLLSQKI